MHLFGTVSDIDEKLAISILSLVFHSHCSVLPYRMKTCSFISMDIIWKMLEKARDGDRRSVSCYLIVSGHTRASCVRDCESWKREHSSVFAITDTHNQVLISNQLSQLLCCTVIMHTTFTSRLCFHFPVVLISFCISSVRNLHACEGQVYRVKGSLTQVMCSKAWGAF